MLTMSDQRKKAQIVDLATGQDLESRQLAEELSAADDFSSTLIEASVDGITAYDLEGRYTLFSPAMERLTGLRAKDVVGRIALEVFPFMKEVGIDKLYEASYRGESVRGPITPYRIPETGIEGYTEQQNFPLFNERGEVTGGMAIIRDVTKIKKRFDALHQHRREIEARIAALEEEITGLRKSNDP